MVFAPDADGRAISGLAVLVNNWYNAYETSPTDFSDVPPLAIFGIAINIVRCRASLRHAIISVNAMMINDAGHGTAAGRLAIIEALNFAADALLTKPKTNDLLFPELERNVGRYQRAVEFFASVEEFTSTIICWMRENSEIVRRIAGLSE